MGKNLSHTWSDSFEHNDLISHSFGAGGVGGGGGGGVLSFNIIKCELIVHNALGSKPNCYIMHS